MIRDEELVERRVTYVLEDSGRLVVIEDVPARIHPETGEQFFDSATVEHLQELIWDERTPDRMMETPVFRYAA